MERMVQEYFLQALAPSTRRSYHSAHLRYSQFCTSRNFSPLPIIQSHLCQFVSQLAAEGVAHRSIKNYLSALRYLQIELLGTDPNINGMLILSYVLQGIKRNQASSGSYSPRPRLPITSNVMRALKRGWELNGVSVNNTMLWAAACCCFFGFLRSGEATVPSHSAYDPSVHLSLADVSVDSQTNPQTVILRIKASKTDQHRVGVNIFLGRTNNDLCPVAAVLSYISRRGTADGPLFHFQNGSPLTRDAFVKEIRSALRLASVDTEHYSGHSFRIGAATSAAAAGVEDAVIKILGRWQSTAYLQYVQLSRESLAPISSLLAA